MAFSPVTASKHIKEKYYRYLKTTFKMGEPYKKEYEALLENQDAFAKGPYLDVTDAFEKGKCIAELIEEGILPKSFSKINMNMTRPLYLHQEKAIRKVATENRNLVVSTGTGSGKTESFLIPILRELATEAEAGTPCPGVRALLIYPMNALANDQTERLRSLLSNYPEIKFGVYTGQTKQKDADAIDMNCPDSEILEIIGKAKEGVLESELYDLIVHDQNYWTIRSLLSSPETVKQIADSMNWTQKQLSDFVSVASMAEKNGGKLFDARYHMFLRATESVFVTLPPDSHVMLHRSTNRYDITTNTSFKVFEAATCSFCSAVYLVGKIENGKLEQYNMSDDISTKELFLLADSINDTDNDHILEDEGIEAEAYRICPYCGSIHKDGAKTHCEHITTSYVKVYRVKFTTERHTLTKCLHCENVNTAGVLRMFFSGQEASTSVIGTALFQELPSYKVTVQKHDADDEFGDDFGFSETIKEKTAKQFIAFSDSRQAAAFYASYLNISYNDILYKRLIVEALKKREASGGLMVPSFVDLLKTVFEKNDIKGRTSFDADSDFGIQKEAWKAILAELVDSNGNTSLSHFGLIGIETDVSGSYKKYHINENEFRSLCSIFAASMMTDAALKYDAPLNESDLEDFTHGGAEYSYTVSESGKRKKAFIPSKAGLSNKRVDYLQKITKKKGMPELCENPDFDWQMFYGAYVRTYIERDVHDLPEIGDAVKFTRFMTAAAASTGQLVNLASMARDVGISQPTAERWLSILVASNIVYLLKPYSNNITKRAVKTPKLYFLDTGLAAYLTRWNTPDVLKNGAMAGAFFESFVISEVIKSYYNKGIVEPPLYFYRDKDMNEIDLVIEENGTLYPLEMKKHADPQKKDMDAFDLLDKIPGTKRGPGGVFCLYDRLITLKGNDRVIPINYL